MKIRFNYKKEGVPSDIVQNVLDLVKEELAARGLRMGSLSIYATIYGEDGYKTTLRRNDGTDSELGVLVCPQPYKKDSPKRELLCLMTDENTGEVSAAVYYNSTQTPYGMY